MKYKRGRRAGFEEPSYWQSFSDMMAALLLIFILIISITLMIYQKKTNDLEQTELYLNSAKAKLDASQLELNAAQKEIEDAKLDLEISRLEIEAYNKELEGSLAELQLAYDKAAATQEELKAAYQEIEDAKASLYHANVELENTRNELQAIVGIRTDIISALQSSINDSGMSVDAQTGSITFSSDVLFAFNSSELTSSSKTSLKKVIPLYLEVLLQDAYRPYIAEIIIEGHTDTVGGYESNLDLSFDRANAVASFCLKTNNGLTKTEVEQLQSLLTVNGRSYSSPVYKEGTTEIDMNASRRVEIKFRLKEDEMIDKIAAILKQQ